MKKKIIAISIVMTVALCGCKGKVSYYDKAQSAMEQGDYEEAIENYSKAIMEDEQLQLSYRGAGICSFLTADYEKAEDYLVRGLQESKGIVGDAEMDMSYYLAETYMCLGKMDEALEVYTNIINYKDETDARIYRGTIYAKQGDIDSAKKDFEKAVAGNKGSISTYYHIYNALKGLDDSADQYLKKGLECNGDTKEDKYMKGCLYMAAGDYDNAIKSLAESKNEGFGKASFAIGEVNEAKGDLQAAVSCYNDYIKVSNPSVAEYVQIINCQINAGEYESAKSNCESAIANAGESGKRALRFEEIVVLEKMGDFGSAKEKMNQFLVDYPDDEKAQHENVFLQTR